MRRTDILIKKGTHKWIRRDILYNQIFLSPRWISARERWWLQTEDFHGGLQVDLAD